MTCSHGLDGGSLFRLARPRIAGFFRQQTRLDACTALQAVNAPTVLHANRELTESRGAALSIAKRAGTGYLRAWSATA